MATISQLVAAALIAVGGTGTLLAVVAFVSKSLFAQYLAKGLKAYEADLTHRTRAFETDIKFRSESSIEQLKTSLQMTAAEDQIRFLRLHEKRAEVIAELYRRLLEASWYGERYVAQMKQQGHQQRYVGTNEKILDLYKFIEINRIYLPDPVCTLLAKFVDTLRKPVINVFVYGDIDNPTPETLKERNEALIGAYKAFKDDIPAARRALEEEFRIILGVNTST